LINTRQARGQVPRLDGSGAARVSGFVGWRDLQASGNFRRLHARSSADEPVAGNDHDRRSHLWGACAPRSATETPQPTGDSTSPAARTVERFITDTMRVLGTPGASICVIRDGRIVWSRALGLADLEQNVPATTETRFRIGSVSKSLTSVAIGRLVQDGPSAGVVTVLVNSDCTFINAIPRYAEPFLRQ
jgi:Beta-lactamase